MVQATAGHRVVMPAQAGIYGLDGTWTPACAGVTELVLQRYSLGH
jgi:hypothetical protein